MPSAHSARSRSAISSASVGLTPRDRLVEQHHTRPRHQRPAYLEELFLPAGQCAREIVGNAREVNPSRNLPGLGQRPRLLRPPAPDERPQQSLARLVRRVQQQVLQHGEAWNGRARSGRCA